MFEFLKRLFRASTAQTSSAPPKFHERVEPSTTRMPREEAFTSKGRSSISGRGVLDEYFRLSGMIESAKSEGNFCAAIRAARDTFPLMPSVIAQMKKEYGGF